jgi:hypothetical protein
MANEALFEAKAKTTASWGPRSSPSPTRSPTLKVAAARREASAFGIHKRQQGHNAGTLNRVGQVTLLLGCQASEPAGKDLAALGDELLEQIDIFVVDRIARLDWRQALLEKRAGQ